jgi:hypothetical protein
MQGEEAYPAGDMDGILMRMITVFGDLIGYVVYYDDGVEKKHDNEEHEEKGEIVKKHGSSTG